MATVTELQATATQSTQAPPDPTEVMLGRAERAHTKPLWLQMARLNPPLPDPRCAPHLWRYADVRPSLVEAGELVPEEQAERRVLMLVNPSRDAPFTTDTLYAGLQLVNPRETARAHRHVAFAMRFIIEGRGGFTAVQGRRLRMARGDVILTPTWHWHDHGNDDDHGSSPLIWLDGLDLPNFQHFPVHFVEHYAAGPRYPAEDVDTSKSPLVFPWARMKKALDAVEGDSAELRYLHEDGSEVSRILGGSATRIAAGRSTPRVQETASSVYHVIEGAGRTTIGDQTLEWTRGDTFCVPSWYPFQHFAGEKSGGEGEGEGEEAPVYLYRFDDKPMLTALGFYRTAETDVEALASS